MTTSLNGFENDNKVYSKIEELEKKYIVLSKRLQHLAGESTIFADMPDWNPAELIGDRPHILDYSMFDYLITDSAWHDARTSQGYHNVAPAKLVVLFGNKPYVDVRNSFNSLQPRNLCS